MYTLERGSENWSDGGSGGSGGGSSAGDPVISADVGINNKGEVSMQVTVLWRMEGEPAAAQASTFSDVEEGMWHTDAVAWAHGLGIVTGSAGRFDPDGTVTRE